MWLLTYKQTDIAIISGEDPSDKLRQLGKIMFPGLNLYYEDSLETYFFAEEKEDFNFSIVFCQNVTVRDSDRSGKYWSFRYNDGTFAFATEGEDDFTIEVVNKFVKNFAKPLGTQSGLGTIKKSYSFYEGQVTSFFLGKRIPNF